MEGRNLMKCEVLVSTMNQEKKDKLIRDMDINDCIIINQITKNIKFQKDDLNSNQRFLSFREKGLSRSRNKAIQNSRADICIVADDDMYYEKEYEKIILNAYKKISDADIIAFEVANEAKPNRVKKIKSGKISYLQSMRLSSVQITFKRKSIINNKITLDEEFGTGSTYYWGEENIFLFDCLRKGLKLYYFPKKIATLRISESSWNKDNTPEHYQIQGAIYYRMSKKMYPILILQFVIRKRSIYKKDMSMFQVLKNMFTGARKYKSRKAKGSV